MISGQQSGGKTIRMQVFYLLNIFHHNPFDLCNLSFHFGKKVTITPLGDQQSTASTPSI
jgi:hypothetical protein